MTTPPIMTITDELLAELEQLAGKATPGPWALEAIEDSCMGAVYLVSAIKAYPQPIARLTGWHDQNYLEAANPATILSLIKHIRSLKTELSIFKASDAQAMRWLAEIRAACGATHGMTFLEMVEHVRELKADAERYRYLRNDSVNADGDTVMAAKIDGMGDQISNWFFGAGLDAAIDAARSSTNS